MKKRRFINTDLVHCTECRRKFLPDAWALDSCCSTKCRIERRERVERKQGAVK